MVKHVVVLQNHPATSARSLVLWKVSIPVNDGFKENVRKVDLRDEDTLENVDADDLRLWKVSTPVNDGIKENVRKVELKDQDALSQVDRLSKVSLDQPEGGISTLSPLPDDVQQARQKRNRKAADKPPSTAGISKEFEKLQTGSAGPVFAFCHPPSTTAMIPITFLHPVFGQFVDDRQNHTPTLDDLVVVEPKFYADEYARAAKFREILMEHGIIMLAASEFEGSGGKTDGDLRWKGLCYLILEAKNELGGGGAEPLFELLLYYLKSMKKRSEEDALARLSSLIIYLSGAHIGFSGAVYTDGPSAEDSSSMSFWCAQEGCLIIAILQLEIIRKLSDGPLGARSAWRAIL